MDFQQAVKILGATEKYTTKCDTCHVVTVVYQGIDDDIENELCCTTCEAGTAWVVED